MAAMSWLDRVRTVLSRQAADAKVAWDQLQRQADTKLTKLERDLDATPEERLAALQREIDDSGDPFADVRARLDEVKPSHPPQDRSRDHQPKRPPPPTGG